MVNLTDECVEIQKAFQNRFIGDTEVRLQVRRVVSSTRVEGKKRLSHKHMFDAILVQNDRPVAVGYSEESLEDAAANLINVDGWKTFIAIVDLCRDVINGNIWIATAFWMLLGFFFSLSITYMWESFRDSTGKFRWASFVICFLLLIEAIIIGMGIVR